MMTPDERIARLEELERSETARLRHAGRAAWMSVVLAAAVMVTLLSAGWWRLSALRGEIHHAETKVRDAETRIHSAETKIRDAETRLAELGRDMETKQKQLAAISAVLGNVDPAQRRAAVEKEVERDPQAAKALPRVYLQVIDPNDRAWATEMGKALQYAGFVVLGVEYVRNARPQERSEVRYYKRAEEEGAKRVADALRRAGLEITLKYLNLESDPRVRPNHFEVWFASRAGGRSP